jgi:Tol biopolymer transport system component
MSESFSNEQWRNILELADAAAKVPKHERLAFLESAGSDPDVIREVLVLTDEFEQPAKPTDRVRTKIDHFIIIKHIGRGGMGDVYSARDLELERTVALKFINPESLGLEGAGERFIREARTASALNHPNIVTIHGVIRAESTVAIVMELVEGTPLRQMCGAPLPIRQVLHIAQQVADAMAAAHAAGVVHRDLKPENVMLRPDGRVKVLDFGLARWFAASEGNRNFTSVPGLMGGTWRYMSPEQCRGETLTGASDVFALGLMLYELATGRHPFHGESVFETLQAIEGHPADPPSKWNSLVAEHLDSLILGMLAKDPAMRPSAQTIAQGLAEYASAPGIPNILAASPTRRRRMPTLWIAVSLLLFAGIAAVLFWRFYRARHRQPAFYEVTTLVPENRATAAAISPDGAFAAYANVDGIFLRATQSGETNALRGPGHFLVDQLSWCANGARLIASGFSDLTNEPSVWSIPVTSSQPRELRAEAVRGVPSPDGTRIASISRDRSSIWVMGASGEEPRKIVEGPGDDTFSLVFWSADGRRLTFQRRHYSGKQDLGYVMLDRYYKRTLESVNLETGKVAASVPDLWIDSAASLPDGRVLFLRLDRPGSAVSNELWEMRTDPSTGAVRGSPYKITSPLRETGDRIYGMSATADGTEVMVLRGANQNAVFVADFEPSPPRLSHARRLTLDVRSNFPHAWTKDSSAVIFESDRNGSWDIFKQPLDQRTPETIVATPLRWEVLPQVSPDGRSVLYAAGPTSGAQVPYTLMRVPIEGGTPQQVPTGGPLDEFRCSLRGRCVLRTTVGRQYYVFNDLDPILGAGRELARTAWMPSYVGDWTLSPDGSQVAIPNHDSRSARIRVVNLKARANEPKERELDLAPLADLSGMGSAADGTGWFVTVDTPIGKRLVYVYLDGRVHPLGDLQGWAVPSPDGRHVAYLNRIVAANAWIIDRR